MRPIEPGAGEQPHSAAIEARMHPIPVVFDFVEPLGAVRRTERPMIDTIDQENNPFVLSISFGDYEELQRWPEGTLDQVNEALQEAALMGLTICVAAGDDGSDDGAGDGLAYCVSAAGGGYHAGTGCDAVTGWARPWAKNCSPP